VTFEVQQNRWDQTIRRASGSIGPGSRVAETLAELFPVFDVENLPAELLFLSGTRIGMGVGILQPNVAFTSKVQLFNPAESGHIITVTKALIVVPLAGAEIRAAVSEPALLTDAGGAQLRDTRVGVSVPSVGQIRTEQVVTSIVPSWNFNVAENVPYTLEDENSLAVLAPGTGYTIGTRLINRALTVNFFWRERAVLESELSF